VLAKVGRICIYFTKHIELLSWNSYTYTPRKRNSETTHQN